MKEINEERKKEFIKNANKKMLSMTWSFAVIIMVEYIFLGLSGAKGWGVVGIVAFMMLGSMFTATYFYVKDKGNKVSRYCTFIMFYLVWSYTLLTSDIIGSYALATAFILIYVLYAERLIINLASVAVTITITIRIISDFIDKDKNIVMLEYTVMIFVMILFMCSAYIATGMFIKNIEQSNEDMDKILEAKKKQDLIHEKVGKILANVYKNSSEIVSIMENMSKSSEVVSAAIDEVSKGASETANEIQEETSYINDIEDKIQQSVNNCESMNKASRDTSEVVKEGLNILNKLNFESDIVGKNTDAVFTLMKELQDESNKIAEITSVISSIAEQTNLLALNASIEAARAGEAGKGFSVVASEIGNLANSSRESTTEIGNIIRGLKEKADKSSLVVDELNKSTLNQNKLLKETNEAFNNINENINIIIDKNSNVKNSIEDVLKSNEVISESISNISAISEETLANTENTMEMSSEHIKESENANKLVKELVNELQKLKDL